MDYTHKTYCRVCGGTNLKKILDLGEMPNANSFLSVEYIGDEKKYPLVVYFCEDCTLVQLLDVVHQEILWEDYSYLTAASKPLVDHFIELGNRLVMNYGLEKGDLIVDIGGNDGSFLMNLKDRFQVLNIEPARKIALRSMENGVRTWNGYFTFQLAETIIKNYGKAKLILCSNVLAHIDDIRDVFRGIELLLDKKGTAVVEVHWVGNLIGDGGFDQIYHEHLCYFSFHSLFKLVSYFNLKIFDVEFDSVHGQSIRLFIEKGRITGDTNDPDCSTWGVHELLFLKERKLGLHKLETYQNFDKKVRDNKRKLRTLLEYLHREGKTIVGYGAPAKGNTLINYCDIGRYIDFIVDTTPLKQGKYTPGSHIHIYPREYIETLSNSNLVGNKYPDYFLLLAWNYASSIISKEDEFLKKSGSFIIPVPELSVVNLKNPLKPSL